MNRYLKDRILNGFTIVASSISVVVLVMIIGFVLKRGLGNINFEMLTAKYWPENKLVSILPTDTTFESPKLKNGEYFIESLGIVVTDSLSLEKDKRVEIVFIDAKSPLNNATSLVSGDTLGKQTLVETGSSIETLTIRNAMGETYAGNIYGDTAMTLSEKMNQGFDSLDLYYKSQGGGIYGSLIATLQLILLSLLFAFPIGVFAAIYLVEIARKTRFTRILESFIELLAGVPSVVFGLMGMTVLYPVVALFNVSGQSVLLGAMTMAVILLPVIIRSVQEALLTVPDDMRSASLSLGATKTQTIFKVLLPTAFPGLLSALILSISRIIGESAALIFTMGSFVNDMPRISESGTTLSVHIWSLMSHEQPNFEMAAAIALIILIVVLLLNFLIHLVGYMYKKRLT